MKREEVLQHIKKLEIEKERLSIALLKILNEIEIFQKILDRIDVKSAEAEKKIMKKWEEI